MRVPVISLLAVLCLGGCAPKQQVAFGSQPPTTPATPAVAQLERHMFALLNRDRTAQGLPALVWDGRLADVGRAHSLDMQREDFFAHESPRTGELQDRMDRAGYLALEARENLALSGSVDSAQANLLDSPGHHANIMSTTVTHVGVGIVHAPPQVYVTQVFARPTELHTPARVEADAMQLFDLERRKRGSPPLRRHAHLDRLLREHIDDLGDLLADADVARVGEAIAEQLGQDASHGLSEVQFGAQTLHQAGELQPPPPLLDPAMRVYGMAAGKARDARGRPRVKLIMLFGR